MNWADIFLLCFAVGALWSLVSLLLGGLHLGHSGHVHTGHPHLGHGHFEAGHAHTGALQAGHPHTSAQTIQTGCAKDSGDLAQQDAATSSFGSWIGSMINPSCAAVFLAWFGGVGYILSRHSGLALWADLALAIVLGMVGAWILAAFLRFLQSREMPLDPADYDMIGVLGRISSPIRAGGVGEVIYVRDGGRKLAPARSESGIEIERGEEVVVIRYEKGIAYVETWEAMAQSNRLSAGSESLPKETKHVE